MKVVAPGEELAFLHPLPVQALWGVGPKTLEKLHRRGVRTVADLADLDEQLGAGRRSAWPTARTSSGWPTGIDDRAVVPDQRAKSIGHEETFARDHHRFETLQHELVRLGDSVAAAAGRGGGRAHGVDQGAVRRLPHDHPRRSRCPPPSTPART